MLISSEPIGSLPRKQHLLTAYIDRCFCKITEDQLLEIQTKEAISCMEASAKAGNKVVTDGEQFKESFFGYALWNCPDLEYISRIIGSVPAGCVLKQAVNSASFMSLLYPKDGIEGYSKEGIPGYSRDEFLNDVVNEVLTDIRGAFEAGAQIVQVDCTELRFSLILDPTGQLLKQFIELNNRVFEQLTPDQLKRTGVHTCPGNDHGSVHSISVDYSKIMYELFNLKCQNFYIEFSGERHYDVLAMIKHYSSQHQKIFLGVTNPLYSKVETPEYVKDLIFKALEYIPIERLGTCDDCGFNPFSDSTSVSIEIALAKMKARIDGTKLACDELSSK